MEMPDEDLIPQLHALLPHDRVLADPAELFVYESDGFTIAKSRPAAVVFPITTEEVVAVVKLLGHLGVQIVPRGSGTGLTGGCVAFENGVIISLAKMTRVLKIDLDNRVAHVEAGVRNTALSDAAAEMGSGFRVRGSDSSSLNPEPADRRSRTLNPSIYHFAPDPGSQRASTIGGNAATNAGGMHTLKDFVSSNHVLGMEMVLADGSVIEVGSQEGSYESPGGFDLPGLICGNEGTFGLITKLWVRLVPKPRNFRTIVAIFTSTEDAGNTVSEIIASGTLPCAMEMMDGRMVQVVEDAFHLGFPKEAQALILTEIDGIEAILDEQMNRILETCRKYHVFSIQTSSDPATRIKLWKARKGAFGAIGRISQSYCTQDACIPRSRLPEALVRINEIGREHGLAINNVFHAGDGNIHPIFLYDDRDEEQVQNVLRTAERILQYCIDLGGTITGEHGIGVEKIHLVPLLYDAATLNQFVSVKHAFDPDERINAGKHIPSEKVNITLLKPGRHAPQ